MASVSSGSVSNVKTDHIVGRRLWWAGPVTILVAVLANLVLLWLLTAILPLDPAFPPLAPGAIVALTLIGALLATLVYALIVRVSAHPVRHFRMVAVIVLILSILPNFVLMANPSAMPFPGGSAIAFGALILFHLLAAMICIILLPALTRER